MGDNRQILNTQPPSILSELHRAQRQAVLDFARQPRSHAGRGIVTTVFDRQFASAWVLLSELARLQVKLPIEAFHTEGEISDRHRDLVSSLGLNLTFRELSERVRSYAIKTVCDQAQRIPRGPVA
jgi:hypothetical protein